MEDKKITVGFLETHFYFYDKSNSMDAYVKNKCDRAFLNIISEASKELGLEGFLAVEVLPPTEGSLVEWIEFLSSPAGTMTAIGAGSALISCLIDVLALLKTTPPTLATHHQLDEENKKLDIQKKKLEIELLRKQLLTQEKETKKPDDRSLNEGIKLKLEDSKDSIYNILVNNPIIRKNLSVFYENLITYQKVKSVGYTTYDKGFKVTSSERIVKRDRFDDFLIDLNELEDIDENAKIIIYSPNLVKGRHKWRGLYIKLDKVINFSMKDKNFKKDVESGVITFKNGATIDAVLVSTIKLDLNGEETSRSYSVETVKKYTIDNKSIETLQGKRYSFNKKNEQSQTILPFDFDD